jgi:hypothetical protein
MDEVLARDVVNEDFSAVHLISVGSLNIVTNSITNLNSLHSDAPHCSAAK